MARQLFQSSLVGSGFVGRATLRLAALRDSVLPPFTSRTAKSILMKARCLEPLRGLYTSSERFRPVAVRVLRRAGGRRLYRAGSCSGDSRIIEVSQGEELVMEVGFYSQAPIPFLPSCEEEVDLDYGVFRVSLSELEVKLVDQLGSPEGWDRLVLRFHTPTTIATKVMIPPLRSAPRLLGKLRDAREAYRLLPTPGYLLAQAARQWIALVKQGDPNGSPLPYAVGRIADVAIAEVDYKLKPVTACYGKDKKGRMRRVRGFTGTLVLEPLIDEIRLVASRLLEFTGYIGLGKSRSIGFGEVSVVAVKTASTSAPEKTGRSNS